MKEIKVYEADEVDRKLTRFIKLVRSAYKEGYREASRGDKTRSAGWETSRCKQALNDLDV